MARSGFEIQKATIKALFLREIRTRFGEYRLGYLWAVLEPAAHVLVLLSVRVFLRDRSMGNLSYSVYLISGILPYFIFSKISNKSINALEANRALFNYRPVKPVDAVLARAILETVIHISVYLFLLMILGLSGESFAFHDFLVTVCALTLMVIFSFGFGLLVMVFSFNYYEIAKKLLPIFFQALYFGSGIIFPISAIPETYRSYLYYNPILHVVEAMRESVLPGYINDEVNLGYSAAWTLVVLFFGLALYRTQEEAMLSV